MTRTVFLGTPGEAVPILAALDGVAEVVRVVTRPDKARGRSSRPIAPPVKEAALAAGHDVAQPSSAADLFEAVASANPEVAVVAAYGRIIKPDLLVVPEHGFINVHFSLLPRWRGASPVVRAILAGDETTGVSLMVMDEGLDTGPVIAAKTTSIDGEEDAGALSLRLAEMGGSLLAATLPAYLEGELATTPQDEAKATAAAKVTTDEALIDPHRHTALSILRAVRAFNPRPGAWGEVEGGRLKVWRAAGSSRPAEIGIARLDADVVVLGASDGTVELLEVQPAGKQVMAAKAWMHGRRGRPAAFTR